MNCGCLICDDGLDYGTKGKWIHMRSKKHQKIKNSILAVKFFTITIVDDDGIIYEIPKILKFIKIGGTTSEEKSSHKSKIEYPENEYLRIIKSSYTKYS